MTREKLLECLIDRPCDVCRYHTENGCERWKCVFEEVDDEVKQPCEDAISRTDAIRVANGYCHWSNISKELGKLPSVNPIPCEDAISRQAVLEGLANIAKAKAKSDAQKSLIGRTMFFVEQLPSVSTKKTGRWIHWYEVIESADGKSTDHIPHCKCSECNYEYDTYSAQFIKYCPNCGAKMEVEE